MKIIPNHINTNTSQKAGLSIANIISACRVYLSILQMETTEVSCASKPKALLIIRLYMQIRQVGTR